MKERAGKIITRLSRAAVRFVALPMLAVYRRVGSPVMYMLGSRCRFYPSCSHYSEDAFRVHGFGKGLVLSTVRLAKCNPLHPGGIDHVPPAGERHSQTCDHDHTVHDGDEESKTSVATSL